MKRWRLAFIVATLAVLTASSAALVSADPYPGKRFQCPRTDGDGLQTKRLEGKRIDRARRAARRHGCTVRVVRRNGENLAVTDDFRSDRINVAVRNQRIKRVAGTY